ncbi:hypothetical protein [Vibrio sp. SCSIO 43140]|nr:hypothetical protein [Vibrio sp. SCSIO 43140]
MTGLRIVLLIVALVYLEWGLAPQDSHWKAPYTDGIWQKVEVSQ